MSVIILAMRGGTNGDPVPPEVTIGIMIFFSIITLLAVYGVFSKKLSLHTRHFCIVSAFAGIIGISCLAYLL